MAWIESHQTLGRHPKMLRCAHTLGISKPQMVGHLHYLWWWALDFAEDGHLGNFKDEEIAWAAEWTGDTTLFVHALLDARFLDQDKTIHNWQLYTGKLVERRRRNREAMKAMRVKHVDTTYVTRVKLPNPTVPNRTVPDPKRERGAQAPSPTIEPGIEEDKTVWPDWYSTLYAIPGFKVPLSHALAWLVKKGLGEERAEETAYALKSKWPGPRTNPYKDPWATFQSWVKRPANSNGRAPDAKPGGQSQSDSEQRASPFAKYV